MTQEQPASNPAADADEADVLDQQRQEIVDAGDSADGGSRDNDERIEPADDEGYEYGGT